MGDIVLSGSLDFLGLGDVIQVIGTNGGTGSLRILSKYAPEAGLVFFEKGNIINARAGGKSGLDAAHALFGWLEGRFEFVEQEPGVEKAINENRMAIILDGNRMLDDGQIERLGPVASAEPETPTPGGDGERPISYPVVKGPLVDYMYVVSEDEFSEGQTIVEENTHGSWNWIILEGVVDLTRNSEKGPVKVCRIGDGAFLGCLDSLSFRGSARNATAVAATHAQLGVLDTQRLTAEYAAISSRMRLILKSMENRFREVIENMVALYEGKDPMRGVPKDLKPAIRQGSGALEEFYTIAQGEAYVVQQTDAGPLLLSRLGEKDFIGKVPFLDIGHEAFAASVLVTPDFKPEKPDAEQLKKEFAQLNPMLRNLIESVATTVMVTSRLPYDFLKRARQKKTG